MPFQVEVIDFETLASTNDYCKNQLSTIDKNTLYMVCADVQTKGRGQHNKSWLSKKGNLHCSFCFKVPSSLPLQNISQITSLVLVDLLSQYSVHALIKWPNDLLVSHQKIAGILTEVSKDLCIVGIGLNVNLTKKESQFIDQRATSLALLNNKKYELTELKTRLLTLFLDKLEIFIEKGFSPFYATYLNHLAYLQQDIIWQDDTTTIQGKLTTIHQDGSLQIDQLPPLFHGSIRPSFAKK